MLKGKHALTPEIEWYRHRSPQLWAALISEAEFDRPRIRWTSLQHPENARWILLGNMIAWFFLTSHFCLTMIKA